MDSLLIFLLDKSSSMNDVPYELTDAALSHKLLGLMGITAEDWTLANRTRRRELLSRAMAMHQCNPTLFSRSAWQTVEAFNHFLRTMQYREDQCSFYMAQFCSSNDLFGQRPAPANVQSGKDDPRTVTHAFVSLFDAAPLDEHSYQATRGTALYDAIGLTLRDVDAHLATLPANEQPTKVTMVIQTDGDDRHSGWQTSDTACEALNQRRSDGWDIIFLAAGDAARQTGTALGFTDQTMLGYDIASASVEAFDHAANAVLEALVTGRLEV